MNGAERRYRVAIRLLWSRHLREAHGSRAAGLFAELHRDAEKQGTMAVIALWARGIVGLLTTRWIEWRRRRAVIDGPARAGMARGALRDVRGGVRQITRRPLATSVILGTLALGIGVNAATFTVFEAVQLSALPLAESERLAVVRMDSERRGLDGWWWSYPNIRDLRASAEEFEAFGVYGGYSANLMGPDGPARVSGARISSGFLSTLGIEPVLGREFTADEDSPNGPAVALIGHRLWEQNFDSRPDVVGTTVTLDAVPYTVVGVLPPAGRVLDRLLWLTPTGIPPAADVFVPLEPEAAARRRSTSGYGVIGRLAAHATLASADHEARALLESLQEEYANEFCCGWVGRVTSLHEFIVGDTGPALTLAVLAAASVLALVCVNLGSLLTVRASERSREFAVRRALGASAARLARQVLVENVVVGVVGGVLGLGLGEALVRGLIRVAPDNLPRLDEITLDGSIALLTIAAAVVVSIAFGVVPALLAARRDPAEVLRAGQVGLSWRGARALRGLIGLEVAMALVLLLSSALLVTSFRNLAAQEPGYRVDGVVAAELQLPASLYPDESSTAELHRALRESLLGTSGGNAVGLASFAYPAGPWTRMEIEGETNEEGTPAFMSGPELAVTPEFFATLEIPLVAGRGFTEADDATSAPVLVVSEAMAAMAWPGANARDVVGRRVAMGSWRPFMRGAGQTAAQSREVIGVVADVGELGAGARVALPYVYQPLAQDAWLSLTVFLRSGGSPREAVQMLRDAVAEISPQLPLYGVESLAVAAARHSARERFVAFLVGGFALLAVVLAAIGIYGAVAYSIALRTREIGLRRALGATSGGVSRVLLRAGLAAPLVGALVGLGGFVLVAPALGALLYEIAPLDGRVLVPACLAVVTIAALATWLPAHRAGRIDPLTALQED